MTNRIGKYVLAGELRNTSRNSVVGWLEFAPDFGIRLELTGNFADSMPAEHLRFTVAEAEGEHADPDHLPDVVQSLADRQIGVVGDFSMRSRAVPNLPIDEFLDLPEDKRDQHLREEEFLYLEWFSQNGRVVAEIARPRLECLSESGDEATELEDDFEVEYGDASMFSDALAEELGSGGLVDDDDEDEAEDPYGLFGSDLERHVAESLGSADSLASEHFGDNEGEGSSWESKGPGIDPETRAMYEQWDEIFAGKKDEPITCLFETTLRLPKPERVRTDKEAEPLVRAILAQLALLSVALDVCEHFSPLDTYRLLMNEILPTAKVHPNLAASEMVQHYSTSDFCEACDAEFEAEEGSGENDG